MAAKSNLVVAVFYWALPQNLWVDLLAPHRFPWRADASCEICSALRAGVWEGIGRSFDPMGVGPGGLGGHRPMPCRGARCREENDVQIKLHAMGDNPLCSKHLVALTPYLTHEFC